MNKFFKFLSFLLCVLVFSQSTLYSYADSDVIKRALQVATGFTCTENSSFEGFTARYLREAILKPEERKPGGTVGRVIKKYLKFFRMMRQNPNLPEDKKNILPKEIEFSRENPVVRIKMGSFGILYFNKAIKGENYADCESFPKEEYELIDEKHFGPYLSRKIYVRKTERKEIEKAFSSNGGNSLENERVRRKALAGTFRQDERLERPPFSYRAKRFIGELLGRIFTRRYSLKDIVACVERNGWVIPENERKRTIDLWQRILAFYEPKANLYETRQHILRVALVTIKIYSCMVPARDREENFAVLKDLVASALGHDIGKAAEKITQVINKTGKLSDREMQLIRAHPMVSLEMLENAGVRLSDEVIFGIVFHHPDYYDDLVAPFFSKMICLADQIDAWNDVSRPYIPRKIGWWDEMKIWKALHKRNYFHNGWIDEKAYTALKTLIKRKDKEFYNIITSTFFFWQRWYILHRVKTRMDHIDRTENTLTQETREIPIKRVEGKKPGQKRPNTPSRLKIINNEEWDSARIMSNIEYLMPRLKQGLMDVSQMEEAAAELEAGRPAREEKKKVILYFDTCLWKGTSPELEKKIELFVRVFENIKYTNKFLSPEIENIEVKGCTTEQILRQLEKGDQNNSIIFTDKEKIFRFDKVKGKPVIAGIEKSDKISGDFYLPLIEIVYFALARYLNMHTDKLYEYYKRIPNAPSLENLSIDEYKSLFFDEQGKVFVIKILPEASKYETNLLVEIVSWITLFLKQA
ncbi:MAG: hypothetical protein ABH883_01415 [Candidatus Omnitrophota bacterium]